jgi:hypothetical protein
MLVCFSMNAATAKFCSVLWRVIAAFFVAMAQSNAHPFKLKVRAAAAPTD